MSKFLANVTDEFRTLTDQGHLSVTRHEYSEQLFGNTVVYLSGRNFRLRIVLDRGDTFADAASETDPDDWAPLERVLTAAGAPAVPKEGLISPARAAELVEQHLSTLENAWGASQIAETKKRIAEMDRLRTEEIMNSVKKRSLWSRLLGSP